MRRRIPGMLASLRPKAMRVLTCREEPTFCLMTSKISAVESSRIERIVGDGEAEAEVLVGGFLYLVAAVPEHYLLGLCLVEPAATTVAQELQRLSEELMVVGHATCVDGRREFDADETTVARRIGEDVGHVARGYERRLARQLLKVRAIRSFRLYRGQLDNVLQKTLLHTRRYLVELVEVDE